MAYKEDDTTVDKTLWSETLIEILCVALKKNNSDEQIKNMLAEIRAKGFKPSYVIRKVEKEIDASAAGRVQRLLKQS